MYTPSWIKLLLYGALLAALVWAAVAAGVVVRLVVLSALLAYLLDPLVSRLEARNLSRTLATSVVFLGLTVVLGTLLAIFYPLAMAEVEAFREGFDAELLRAAVGDLETTLETRMGILGVNDLDLIETAQAAVDEAMTHVLDYVPGVLALFGQLVIIPFLLFFLLKDSRRIKRAFMRWVPNRAFEFTLLLLHKADAQVGNYLRGQVIASAVVALLSILALWLLGVDYFVLIGVFAGLTNLVPYLGPVTGAVVAVAVSVLTTGSFDTALPIVLAFAAIQAIDNAVVQPLVIARTVRLHPLLVVLALLVGAQLFGFLGLLLAVPAASVAKVLLEEAVVSARRYRVAG